MNVEDPKLTAYALGELAEGDAAPMAEEIARSPAAKEAVDETQTLARLLRAEYMAELKEKIGEGTRRGEQAVPIPPVKEAALSANLNDIRDDPWFWSIVRPLAIAAVLALLAVIGGGALWLSRNQGAGERVVVTDSNIPTRQEAVPVEAELPNDQSPPSEFKEKQAPLARAAKLAGNSADAGLARAENYEPAKSALEKDRRVRAASAPFNTADYGHFLENPFLSAASEPLSTFSIDVDTASYSIVRRFLNSGQLPPRDAVRIEEMINYFRYDYSQPKSDEPFSINLEVAGCPWESSHRLVRIGLKGREIAPEKRSASNLVFLLDVSGSMEPVDRLPLVKQSMRLLVEKLTENDRVAIVVYAGASGVALPSTTGDHKEEILAALENLQAGGSTNGAEGIGLAYKIAADNFIKGGVNRVILATDGDFNVGVTSQGELIRLIEEKAKSGVFLSVLGVGDDNLKDSTMQNLADKGNGNYAYLDSLEEARKVLVQQMDGTLVTIAKDVKVQVEWNPDLVSSYRLIGYEKRLLRKEDFNNDKVDAGEIGAGHTVTALYEVVPVGVADTTAPAVDALKYSSPPRSQSGRSNEMLTVKLRYKKPDGDRSELLQRALLDDGKPFANAPADFKWTAAVAEFGMLLRESEFKGNGTLGAVEEWAQEGKGGDVNGYRAGFIELVRRTEELKKGG